MPEPAKLDPEMATVTKMTREGALVGTLQYMAPEQVEGKKADARTDIFAFGAVLYEMMTGRRAFEGKSKASLIGAILKDEPPSVSTAPPALDHVVRTCLAKDPDDRWQTAADLGRYLTWIRESGSRTNAAALEPARERRSSRLARVGGGLGNGRRSRYGALDYKGGVLLTTECRFSVCGNARFKRPPQAGATDDGGPVSRWDASGVRRAGR